MVAASTANEEKKPSGKGRVSIEKAVKCKGGVMAGEAGLVGCEATLKAEFNAKSAKDEMADFLASHVKDQLIDVSTDDTMVFMPSQDALDELGMYDDAVFVESLPDG